MKFRLMLVLLLGAAACGERTGAEDSAPMAEQATAEAQSATYTDIGVRDLQDMLETKDFVLVNVHIPFAGDLPSTDASIPFDEIADHLDELPANKDARIVLYCRSGNMSEEAAHTLTELGYTNVFNLTGGFRAWRDAGLPLVGI